MTFLERNDQPNESRSDHRTGVPLGGLSIFAPKSATGRVILGWGCVALGILTQPLYVGLLRLYLLHHPPKWVLFLSAAILCLGGLFLVLWGVVVQSPFRTRWHALLTFYGSLTLWLVATKIVLGRFQPLIHEAFR